MTAAVDREAKYARAVGDGRERVEPPPPINEIAIWVQRGETQIHFLFTEEPVVPPGGHVAVVAEEWQAPLDRLRDPRLSPQGPRPRPDGWTVVTRDGSLAAHFEHSIAVTEAGPEILTTVREALLPGRRSV